MIGEANTAGGWAHVAAHEAREARYAGTVHERYHRAPRAMLRELADVEHARWVGAVQAVLRWVHS